MPETALSSLTDRELLRRLQSLVRKERITTVEILLHLSEVEARSLHLSLGYGSLFAYCTELLGYSRAGAGRRIVAARAIRDHPELETLLMRRQVSLMTVSLIGPVLRTENKEAILSEVRGKSQRDVEALVARYRGPSAYRDRVRAVAVQVPRPAANEVTSRTPTAGPGKRQRAVHGLGVTEASGVIPETGVPATACEKYHDSQTGSRETFHNAGKGSGDLQSVHPAGDNTFRSNPVAQATTAQTTIESRLLIEFLASRGFMRKYDEVRSLLSNRLPDMSFQTVFEAALDLVIEAKSPAKRMERREKRKAKRSVAADTTQAVAEASRKRSTNPRHIPAGVRDAVYERDGGRCTFVGHGGKRCGSSHRLQIDHIVPVARGGRSAADNLRLLCAKHNQYEAERVLGPGVKQRGG